MRKKRLKHIVLSKQDYILSKKLLEYCELWFVDESPKPTDEMFAAFLKKNRKIKNLLTPDKVHKILNSYRSFCEVVRDINNKEVL